MKLYDRKINDFDVPPMTEQEKLFLFDGINPDLIPLYEKIREKILLFGNIEARVTRNYINFRHPYKYWNYAIRQKEVKMGTVSNVSFRKGSVAIAFNTLGKTPLDPHNFLKPTKSHGICTYYGIIESSNDLEVLEDIIKQVIFYVSNEHRVVRINNKFITI